MFQGVTFKVEGGELVIARILHGGMIDQQGLLHVGDIIKEVSMTRPEPSNSFSLMWDQWHIENTFGKNSS